MKKAETKKFSFQKIQFSNKLLIGIGLILIVFSLIAIFLTTPKFQSVTLSQSNESDNQSVAVSLYEKPKDGNNIVENKEMVFRGKIYKGELSQNYIKLNIDDCLTEVKVNGEIINLQNEIIKSSNVHDLCGGDNDLTINLGKFLKKGDNDLEIKVQNYGSYLGLIWNNSWYDPLFLFFLSILNLGFLFLLIALARSLKLKFIQTAIVFLGLVIREYYLSFTEFYERAHDVLDTGHFGYIKFVFNNWKIPNPYSGWEYFQAPLYYFVSAIYWKALTFFEIYNIFTLLQFLNLLFFVGFLIVSLLILNEFFEKWTLVFASFLLVFWPSGIIHSVRITNDVLYYFFFALTLYFTIKWQKSMEENYLELTKEESKSSKSNSKISNKIGSNNKILAFFKKPNLFLYLAFISLALTISSKISGIILAPIIGITLIWLFFKYRKNWKKFIKLTWLPILIGALLSLISIVIIYWKKFTLAPQNGKTDWLIASENGLDKNLFVGNDLYNFLSLDLENWLKYIYLDPFNNNGGRQFFIEYLLKSSLFGEFSFNLGQTQNLAVWLNVCLGVIILVAIFNLLSFNKFLFEKYLVVNLNLIFGILALAYYRNKTPCACNQDFRFIYPTVISIVILSILGIQRIDNNKYPVLKWLLIILILSFIFTTVYFFQAISF